MGKSDWVMQEKIMARINHEWLQLTDFAALTLNISRSEFIRLAVKEKVESITDPMFLEVRRELKQKRWRLRSGMDSHTY